MPSGRNRYPVSVHPSGYRYRKKNPIRYSAHRHHIPAWNYPYGTVNIIVTTTCPPKSNQDHKQSDHMNICFLHTLYTPYTLSIFFFNRFFHFRVVRDREISGTFRHMPNGSGTVDIPVLITFRIFQFFNGKCLHMVKVIII